MAAHFLFLCVLKSAPADARRCEEKCEKIKCSKTERAKDTARKGKMQRERARQREREQAREKAREIERVGLRQWQQKQKHAKELRRKSL